MPKIILDLATVKALAGETRVRILKQLQERNYMQTELGTTLKLAVPTIKEHLNALENAELVHKIDEGRKWKYYELTQKGKAILTPPQDNTTLLVLLGTWIAAVVGGIVSYVHNIRLQTPEVLRETMQASTMPVQFAAPAQTTLQWNIAYWVFLGVLTIDLVCMLLKRIRKPHQ